MTTRRQILQATMAFSALPAYRSANASADPTRLALVIGNAAYQQAPLANPVRDAQSVANLLQAAGLTVHTQHNARRADMLAAIQTFGSAANQPQVQQILFYYAGHGVQMDWRNYLLPIDAQVTSAEQVPEGCIALHQVLEPLSALKNKTLVIILDACRNNPFGTAWQAPAQGLSQFDAPPGSLIAYATAPGNVASDGAGQNGLYTEHLVRELGRKNTRIEDAFKRVRLNVRMASDGVQVPWESTSLENDVFLFASSRPKRTATEIEQELLADMAAWARIKGSTKVQDWASYLQTFPNGHFSEVAQEHLSRLSTPPANQPTAQTTALSPPPPALPAIDIRNGRGIPAQLKPAAGNPYSAGLYPHGRIYTVGDEHTLRVTEWTPTLKTHTEINRVTRVLPAQDRVEYNDGEMLVDLMGNPLNAADIRYDAPAQLFPSELFVGKNWQLVFAGHDKNGHASNTRLKGRVVGRENVTVPAGSFDAFVIVCSGWATATGERLENRYWIVPGLQVFVQWEQGMRHGNDYQPTLRKELVALRQQFARLQQ